jgi:hypothetical protein
LSLVVVALLVACHSSPDVASDILRRTIPLGQSVPVPSRTVVGGQSTNLKWDLETASSPSEYVAWVKPQFHDFQIVADAPSQLRLTKLIGGDASRLSILTEPRPNGGSRIYVELNVAPD